MKDPEKSHADSAAQSHKNHMKDQENNRADIAARFKANYNKDVQASWTVKDKDM